MDAAPLELAQQSLVEPARVREERKARLGHLMPRVVDDLEKVFPEERLSAGEEDFVDSVRGALVDDALPSGCVELGFR